MMIVLTWLVHCIFIAAVLTAGAFAWEAAARWSGGAARWGWLTALAGSVALPWLVKLVPAGAVEALPVGIPMLVLEPLSVSVGPAQSGLTLTEAGLYAWVASSAAMLFYVWFALLRLQGQRRRWREADLDGGRVLLTHGVGPAAVGVRDAMVIIPTWALQLDAELRSLLLRHEREHVSAGDPRLLLAGLVLVAAMPWNPLVWLQVLRLRNAIELDCDARVLAGGADPERYGSLLLEVGQRRSAGALVMATFAEPRVFLEQRIRRIARWPLDRRPVRAFACALMGIVLFTTALSARDPLRSAALATAGAGAGIPVVDMIMPSDTPPAEPSFTPMTVRPELQNRAEVVAALNASYPPLLRDAGIGGAPMVWLYIDEQGAVSRVQISRSSGYPALDQAALSVAAMMQFSPALNRAQRVGVWIELPIIFGEAGQYSYRPLRSLLPAEQPQRAEPRSQPAQPRQPEQPGQARMTRPELLNGAELARVLVRNYPPLLRDAGIGGDVMVRVTIDEQGAVTAAELISASGYGALDEAGLYVAKQMRFTRPERAPAQLDVPVSFSTDQRRPLREQTRTPAPPGAQPPELPTHERMPAPARMPAGDLASGPQFTPMTHRPELLNRDDVAQALVRSYPPELRNAGIGGAPQIWFLIDETGHVARVRLSQSSGHPALDDAALEVASQMRFSPARNRDREVAVWVEIPIVFTAR